jgi:SAM-dependent methyltransferase
MVNQCIIEDIAMKNPHLWQPSKFVYTRRGLAASPDPEEIAIRSRIIGNLSAAAYERVLTKHATGALLDAGCGKVPLYEVYRNLVSEVVCVDWANTFHPNPHLDLEADLNQGIPFPDGRFDTVVSTDVLEHLANPNLFWAEVTRVLRPSGKVIVGVPFLYWLHEPPHDHYRYTRYRLSGFCDENGLSVLSLEEYGGPLAVVLDVIGKNLPGTRLAEVYQFCGTFLLDSPVGRYIEHRRRHLFPLGYCLVAQKGT